MTRSRLRKLQRIGVRPGRVLRAVPLASAIFAAVHPALAADEETTGLQEVVVTAQKRAEDLQSVPLSITAINAERLEQLHITNFDDYVKFLPSVTSQGGGAGGGAPGPGFSHVIMRGVSSDSTFNHSGPLPTVGTYLDEQPITTIQGALDLHIYDIERVEALAGPQGTLYGASSEAGTIRIITNKPDPRGFKAGYDLDVNRIANGDPGGTIQGFINLPLSPNAAIRLVGWVDHQGGYIDNVHATRTFPQFGITIDNGAVAKNNYNDVTTYGARAALKVDLNDNWTVTPTLIGQETKAYGFGSAFNPAIGDLQLEHFSPDYSDDHFIDAALTVEGKISNFDLVYAGAFLKRNDITHTDYSDYSLAYDNVYPSYTSSIVDNAGNHINPTQMIWGKDGYTKQSHELRLQSPADWPVRFITGVFYQRQEHHIEQRYVIDNLAQSLWVTGWPDTWWLTEQVRVDRDYAFFGEVTWDITSNLSFLAGLRHFKYDNSLAGFRGFGLNNPLGAGGLGEQDPACVPVPFNGAPCTSFNKDTTGTGNTPKFTLTYKFDDKHLAYLTYSKGFRPGGINRVGDLPPYQADFLKNYELGWKTTWLGNRLRFNGALFWEDWDNFQFSFLGANSLTRIANAGAARIKGVESDIAWAITPAFTLTGALSVIDSKLSENYCGALNQDTGAPITICPTLPGVLPVITTGPQAPSGTQMPGTSKVKGNIVGRYAFGLLDYEAFAQGALVYQSSQWDDLRIAQREAIGQQPGYGVVDLSVGAGKKNYTLELYLDNVGDRRGQNYRFEQCGYSCTVIPGLNYVIPTQPRTIGLKFEQKF